MERFSLLKRRLFEDRLLRWCMRVLTILSLFCLAAIATSLIYKSVPILKSYPLMNLLSGVEWSPFRGEFGFKSFILSSIYVTALAIIIGLPGSLLTALFLTERSHPLVRRIDFPVLAIDRKNTRLNSSHIQKYRMPSSASSKKSR